MNPAIGTSAQALESIAVEEFNDDDHDSDYDTGASTETTTLSTSITKYQFENGRRYHAYKEGSYNFPNDEKEQDRLDLYHHIWRLRLGGRLHLAPIERDIQHVLDIGTGTGIWAIDFADEHESAEIIGTDISPIQPRWVPPNVKFEVDDAEAPWTFTEPFNYIHGRSLGGCIQDWDKLYQQCFQDLTPGGWLEMQDIDTRYYCDDDSLTPDDPLVEWQNLLNEAAEKSGRVIATGPTFKSGMARAGFEGIEEVVVKCPCGLWPADQKEKEIGLYQRQMMLEGLEGMSLALFTRILQWTPEQVKELVERAKKTFLNRKVHIYTNWYVVYGRKPEKKQKGKYQG